MDQQIETFESKIRAAFKKVKQDVALVKGYLKKQDELLKSVKKELSDTVSSNDFYKFTEKLSEKLDGLRTYYVGKDEYTKAQDRLEKEISTLKTLIDSSGVKTNSSEIQAMKKDYDKLRKDIVMRKDYEKLLDDAEHNFKELAKEVSEAKSYEKDISELKSDVSKLLKQLEEKEKPEKKTKAQEKQELKLHTLVEDNAAKSEALEREISLLRGTVDEVSAELNDLQKQSGKKQDNGFQKEISGFQKEMQKEFDSQRKGMESSLETQERTLQKLASEIQLKIDESQFSSKIEEEVQAFMDRSDFIRVDELNQKIDEFNLALEDLASQKEVQKSISVLEKEQFNPLKKEITQLTKEQEALRKILTRLEESKDSDSSKKLSAFELRLDRIEEASQSSRGDDSIVKEIQALVKDLEEEQKMLISEISDISSKPSMNEKIIQSLSKDFEELKERVEELDISMPRGKKGKDNDLELLRSEIEFLRNNFVTQGDIDSTLTALSDELSEMKSKMSSSKSNEKEAARDAQELASIQSDVSQIKKHLSSKVILLEAESDKYSGQIALLYEDMRKSLERQSFLERRLADLESVNDTLSAKEKDARISYESAKDQLQTTERRLQQIEIESDRKAKSQLTLEESSFPKEQKPGFLSRLWAGFANFFSSDDDESIVDSELTEQTEKKKDVKHDSKDLEDKQPLRSLKDNDDDDNEGFKFFEDEEKVEPKKKPKGKTTSKKVKKDEDDELY